MFASDWSFILMNDWLSFDFCRVLAIGVWVGACNGFHVFLVSTSDAASFRKMVFQQMISIAC